MRMDEYGRGWMRMSKKMRMRMRMKNAGRGLRIKD